MVSGLKLLAVIAEPFIESVEVVFPEALVFFGPEVVELPAGFAVKPAEELFRQSLLLSVHIQHLLRQESQEVVNYVRLLLIAGSPVFKR